MPLSTNTPDFVVYGVEQTEKGKRDNLTRIGAAWKHKKGEGINIRLSALPLEGKIVLFPPKAEEAEEAQTGNDEEMPF
jgi:hypothetical protein